MMPRTLLLFLSMLVSQGGCGSVEAPQEQATESREGEQTQRPAGRVVDGFYVAEGAPDPLACQADAECTFAGVPDASGCCWSFRDMNAAVMSTAYRTWVSELRASCDASACPSPPVPAQPPGCLFEVRCREGRCVNEC